MTPADQDRPDVRVQLLGPLSLLVDGAEIELAAPMHRALTALLAINANAVVSTEQLIDELWSQQPPEGARATLQSYVSVLRRKCRDAGRADLIETRSPGYLMRLEPAESDVAEFRSQIAAAQQHGAAAAESEEYVALARALELVSGPVLEDLNHLDTVRVFINDIDEHRRWAIAELVGIDIRRGRAADVVPRLQAMVASHPLEERTWAQLMRALHQSGRQSDALRAYQELRELLVEELGVEPSAHVKAVEREILEGRPADGSDSPRRVTAPGRRIVAPPHHTAPLIGRVAELIDLQDVIGTHRLITVTGPGGCGKTRLAAEVAHTIVGEFDLVAWVELNSIEEAGAVPEAVAAALGLFRRQADGILDLVADELADVPALLVLDNCEHLIDEAAEVIDRLLAACPMVKILATSRERLLIPGEYSLPLPPLASASPLELTRSRFEKPSEAASLFIDRAGIDKPGQEDLAIIEAICAQLDGIPLAIELAAPLAQLMTYDEIADRLLDRFRLLSDTQRAARPQHRTLRAVVEWSHDLLAAGERDAFAALSVFRGPFSSDAASAVISVTGYEPSVLTALVRKSLVFADTTGPSTRYRVLETLRAFGAEQLALDPEQETAVSDAFVLHYASQSRRWARRQQTATVSAWLVELGPDIANFQAAVARARETDMDAALTMIDSFQWYFNYIGQMPETRAWLRRLQNQALSLEQRAIATLCQASLANFSGDYGATGQLAENALAAARKLGDDRRLNAALIIRGTTATFEGNAGRAAECFIESAKLSEALGDLGGIAASMAFWGIGHRRLGQFDEASACFNRAFEGFSRLADDRGMALVIGNAGRMVHQQGDLARGRELTRRGLEMARQSLDPMVSAQCALFCGHVSLDSGLVEQSIDDFESALHNALIPQNRTMSSAALEWMVMIGGGEPDDVAVIDAFTHALRNSPGTASPRVEWDAAVQAAEEALDPARHRALTADGEGMSLDEAIEYARAVAARALRPGNAAETVS